MILEQTCLRRCLRRSCRVWIRSVMAWRGASAAGPIVYVAPSLYSHSSSEDLFHRVVYRAWNVVNRLHFEESGVRRSCRAWWGHRVLHIWLQVQNTEAMLER